MAYAKRWFVEKAFAKIGLADYVFDLSPEQLQGALEDLDTMMAEWDGQGIRVGWSIPNAENESSLDNEVNVPYFARSAIWLKLGIRIAPDFGKTPSQEHKSEAKAAMNTLMTFTAKPVSMQFPNTTPSGAGNKPWRNWDNPFLGPPVDQLAAGGDGPIDLGTLNPNDQAGAP